MARILISFLILMQGIPVQQGGTVRGVLRDSAGMPIPGIRMAAVARADSLDAVAEGTAMAGITETDAEGKFTLENIPPGRYVIAAGRLDLQTYFPGTQELASATVVAITPGATLSDINFALNNTSFGRSPSGFGTAVVNAVIPLRVAAENGNRVPVAANGRLVALRFEPIAGGGVSVPIDATSFNYPGRSTMDFRVTVENLPENYTVKSITYGSADVTHGTFRVTWTNLPVTLTPPVPPNAPSSSSRPPSDLAAQLQAYIVAVSRSLPTPLPTSTLTITLAEKATTPGVGVRVSGSFALPGKRLVYISGKPGVSYSDGTFEFRNVAPGRHVIATPNTTLRPLAAIVIVGDKDLNAVELKETMLLPPDVLLPVNPVPAGDYAAGSTVPLARVRGVVIEEATREPIREGHILIRTGENSRTIPIDADGHFETFALLPGSYEIRPQIFGHVTTGPAVVVEDKDIELQLTPRRLY